MLKYIINNQFVDQDKAFVHVSDLALLRGYGIFDFFRLEGLMPLFIDDHLDRFFNSAQYLRLKCPVSKSELKNMILKLITVNHIDNSGIRMVLTGGESPNGYFIGEPTLIVINEPINPLPIEHFDDGIKIITHEYLRDLPEVKTINYLMGIYKLPETKSKGAVDVLYHWNGKISELTRSNFFIVKDNIVITAREGILKGITRKKVLELAKKRFKVEERDLFLDELDTAQEAFITGTTKKVMPVKQVDERVIGNGKPGRVTLELQKMIEDYISELTGTKSSG